MIDDLFRDLGRHAKEYVIHKVPNPFLGEGITFIPISEKLVLATAIFNAEVHAEISAAGKNLECLTAGGIADYYNQNPLPNTYLQIELAGGDMSPGSGRVESNLKLYYIRGPRIIVPEHLKATNGRPRHPPTEKYKGKL